MSSCCSFQIANVPSLRPRSWLTSSIDTVKFLVKFKNSVMPSEESRRRDEAAFCFKVSFLSDQFRGLKSCVHFLCEYLD